MLSAQPSPLSGPASLAVRLHEADGLAANAQRFDAFVHRMAPVPPSREPGWLWVLARAMRHVPYCLEAVDRENTVGLLPLALVRSVLFGRFLVSLPYLNSAGVVAENPAAGQALIDEAVRLADRLDVRYLELRHERAVSHPELKHTRTDKVHMRRRLPEKAESLWSEFSAKVRNQVRKGERNELAVRWGRSELLKDFYAVFSQNMRDLGTPVYGRGLFASILDQFPDRAEFCVVGAERGPLAAALLVHGDGVTEVPSASSLRRYNDTNANMLMYWHLLKRAVERGQNVFDFGRSSKDGSTYRFKKQWGAEPHRAEWQYYVRTGTPAELRPDNPKYLRRIRLWQRLPVWITRLIGPWIVRGIP